MSLKFKATMNGSLKEKLNTGKVGHAMDKAVRKTMKEVSETSAKLAPKKTGNLRRSHSYETRYSGTIITGMVKNSANYWVYVNFGTSRIKNPSHFLERAVNKVNVMESIKKNFKANYKGGK